MVTRAVFVTVANVPGQTGRKSGTQSHGPKATTPRQPGCTGNPLRWAVLVCVRAGLPPMKGERMSFALRRNLARRLLLVLAPALAAFAAAFAQGQPAAPTSIVFAINEV